MIISLGWRCHIAKALRQLGLRTLSLPLDWTMIANFNDILSLFEFSFQNFTTADYNSLIFPHWTNKEEMRSLRLWNLLSAGKQRIIFVRHANTGYGHLKYRKSNDSSDLQTNLILLNKWDQLIGNIFPKLKYKTIFLWDDKKSKSKIPFLGYNDSLLEVWNCQAWDSKREETEPKFRKFLSEINERLNK